MKEEELRDVLSQLHEAGVPWHENVSDVRTACGIALGTTWRRRSGKMCSLSCTRLDCRVRDRICEMRLAWECAIRMYGVW